MLSEGDPWVEFKLDILKRAMPARSAIVFGDMYLVDGAYTKKCLEYGCKEVLLVDTLETPLWQETRLANPSLEFYKGDFSNTLFMKSFTAGFDVGVVFDVLLHQAPLLNTLHLMLEKVTKRFCIVQPMLREQKVANSLIYLPGNPHTELHPLKGSSSEVKIFDVHEVNHSHWIWGMTVSFLTSVLKGEGFKIVHQREFDTFPNNENWVRWGCVAERTRPNPHHWSASGPSSGLYQPYWN